MRSLPGFIFSAAAMLMTGAAIVPVGPARAEVSFNINFGFNYFHDRLADGGRWLYSPIWGDVWQPRQRLVGYDFQPYTNGYWQYTSEYGWYWVSEDRFDDVVYHYGRWVYDPDTSWVWIPGYTWSPGWVVWREGDGYSGWLPMPPDEEFVSGSGLSLGMNFGSSGANFYGYNRWYGNRVDPDRFWVFVDNRNLANRDYRRFVVPRERARVLITNTRNVTRFEVVNNRVVNRSIDVRIVERASGHRIAPVPAREVMKRDAIVTTVDESNRIRQRERVEHPIRANFVRGGAGAAMGGANGNRPDNAFGRPGGAMGAGQQNGAGEGGKRDRNNTSGGGMTGGAEQPNGTAEGGKRDRNSASGGAMTGGADQPNGAAEGGKRDRNNNSGGAMTGGAEQPNGTAEGGKRDHNNASGGAMTGGVEQTNGTAEGGKRDRSNASGGSGGNAATGASGAAASGGPADNEKATHKPRSISNGSSDSSAGDNNGAPDRTSHARNNGTMTGPEGGGQPNGTSSNESTPSDAAKRNHRNNANPGGATGADNGTQNTTSPNETRTPRNNPGGAMTGPSDNTPPAEPKHRPASPGGGGMNGPAPNGAAPANGTPNTQQPDNNTPKKKPKHNPPGTPPDTGTPQ